MSLQENRRVRMPRGKYRYKFIDQLPTDYLRWVAEHWDENNRTTK